MTEVSELVAQYVTSGLTQTEFCRQHGLDLSTLRRRLLGRPRSAAGGTSATKWVAVELSPSSDAKAGPSASGVVLVVGSCRIELARGFDGETLRPLPMMLAGR
ncbi:MAG: hypothetical protein QXN56_03675 [Candidatus Hadarchaeum sp.]